MADFVEPSLLVPALRNDLNMRALETLAARLSGLNLAPSVLYDFDHVEASALIHLAEQFNVLGDAGWDMANTEAKKRALLKEAVALHRIKGTPYAVKRSLELLGVNATVTEWFQTAPKGQPYTFILDAQVTDQPAGAAAIDAARIDQIKRVVSFWKPVRCHFNVQVSATSVERWQIAGTHSGYQRLSTKGALAAVGDLARGSTRWQAAGTWGSTTLLSSYGVARSNSTASSSSQIAATSIFAGTALLVSPSTIH